MKINKNYLKLAKKAFTALTILLGCATMILRYTGIVVYFEGQKSRSKQDKLGLQNKNQNKKTQLLAGQNQSGGNVSINTVVVAEKSIISIVFSLYKTFWLLSKRFFVACSQKRFGIKRSALYQNQNINKNKKGENYDCGLLSSRRHFDQNRSEQNYFDPLGRSWVNTQSWTRQSRMALLHQGTSRRNCSISSRDKLFSRKREGSCFRLRRKANNWLKQFRFCSISSCLISLSLLILSKKQNALSKNKIYNFNSLNKFSNEVFAFSKNKLKFNKYQSVN